jgi:hypothetical protein
MEALSILIVAAVLGLIPAWIASSKDHDFFLWWLFGAVLFIIALPVAILIQPKGDQRLSQLDAVDKLDKLNRLRSEGVISEAEFEGMRRHTLAAAQPARRKYVYDPTIPPNPQPTRIILYGLGGLVVVMMFMFLLSLIL